MYKSNCNLHGGYDADNEGPVFVQLKYIFVRNQTPIVFYCEKMDVLGFDNHFHAWRVQHTWPTTYVCIDPYNLSYYLPHLLQSVTLDGTIYVLFYLCIIVFNVNEVIVHLTSIANTQQTP